MPYQPFDIALHEGELAETEFAQAIRLAFVEHKDDRMARKTGNVFIEYSQRTGPSGISTTAAQFWAMRYAEDCWFFMPTSLLRALATRAWNEGRRRPGGDFDNEGVLIPLEWLAKPWETAMRANEAA